MAAAGVAEHAVFHAVERVAFVVHGVREQGNFRGGDVAVAFHGHGGPEVAAGVVAGPVVGGVARDDAVEIGRIALGFDERFMAALGTTVEVGMRGGVAVESVEDDLVGFRHDVHAAIGKVGDSLRVAQSPCAIVGVGADVTGIRAAGRVTSLERLQHGGIADGPGQPAVSDGEQFVVPLRRHPQLEAHFRRNHRDDAAESGHLTREEAGLIGLDFERTRGHRRGGNDSDSGQVYGPEVFAFPLRVQSGDKGKSKKNTEPHGSVFLHSGAAAHEMRDQSHYSQNQQQVDATRCHMHRRPREKPDREQDEENTKEKEIR